MSQSDQKREMWPMETNNQNQLDRKGTNQEALKELEK